jgi:capsular exopolysaccharide synthesis family protein
MSRNFDLMEEMESERAFRSHRIIEPAFPIPGENRNRDADRQLTSDLTLSLVQRIFLQQTLEPPRMVVFAGIDHGNGCSQIAASVAETLAGNAPGAVCLVEGNFRSPGLPAMLGTTNYHGLTDALLEEAPIRSFIKLVCNDSLWLLSSGPLAVESPSLLTSERMKALSAELRREFDFVIVDAPPLTRCADAIALGQLSDGVVLVLEANSTRRETALAAAESLRSSGIQIIGAVLNKRTFPIPEKIYNRL